MKLEQYMANHQLTDEEMSVKLGNKSRSTISRYRRGEVIPPPDVIREIQSLTGSAVQFDDWFEVMS